MLRGEILDEHCEVVAGKRIEFATGTDELLRERATVLTNSVSQ
jgi:hypothetical protein